MITLADIAGNGAAQQVASPNITARQVYLSVTGSGGSSARIGDSNTGSGRGLVILAGAQPFVLQSVIDMDGNIVPFNLASLYVYAANGVSVQIAYEPFTG